MTRAADDFAQAWSRHQAGALDEAEQLYRQVLSGEPQHADAWHRLGVAVHQRGRHAEAAKLIEQAVALDPHQPAYWNHLGAASGAAGNLDYALDCFSRAIALSPADGEIRFNLGAALALTGQLEKAVEAYDAALRLQPDLAPAAFNGANALRDLGATVEAEQWYRRAVALKPDYADAYNNLGSLLQIAGRWEPAIEALQKSLEIRPGYVRALNNLGVIYTETRELDAALDTFRQVIASEPQFAEAHNNLGVALMQRGDLSGALLAIEQALALEPDYAEARKNRGVIWLFQGDFARGWREFQWRSKCKNYPANPFRQPAWDGSPLAGRTILLHTDQGLGDTLQFVRFAPEVACRGGRVVLVVQPSLVSLLEGIAGIDRVIGQEQQLPECEVQAALMSLPALLGGTPADYSAAVPYLHVRRALIEHWQAELPSVQGLRVGLVWQGNPQYRGDQFRSIPLAEFEPLTEVAGVALVSLQQGDGSEQLHWFSARERVTDLAPRLDRAGAFLDTAAVMKSLDLVITSDTAAAHLAGALGVPVWLALAQVPEWRWMLDREDSPWYPTMRLFRQPAPGDWTSVFRRMAVELTTRAARRTSLPDHGGAAL